DLSCTFFNEKGKPTHVENCPVRVMCLRGFCHRMSLCNRRNVALDVLVRYRAGTVLSRDHDAWPRTFMFVEFFFDFHGAGMRNDPCARRVVVVILDGLRPDAIDRFGLSYVVRLMVGGVFSCSAATVTPSVTAAALTSLMTGVSPQTHGLASDRVF